MKKLAQKILKFKDYTIANWILLIMIILSSVGYVTDVIWNNSEMSSEITDVIKILLDLFMLV